MKKLLKNKKVIIVVSSVLVVLLIFGTVLSLTRGKRETKPVETEPTISETIKDVVIDEPVGSTESQESQPVGEIKDEGNALKPDESVEETTAKTAGSKADETEKPEEEIAEPAEDTADTGNNGIHIGGNPPVEEIYNCGCTNHHCQNDDFHASLLNRELEGCPYCGSHSCKSFYAVNEWGFTYYDATLCPSYNVQKDSAKVCPDCGRPMWSPDNPTGCFRYLQDTQCECGQLVPGNTCHHH